MVDSGFDFQLPPEGKPSLGDAAVVADLVREFVDNVFTIDHEFRTGMTESGLPVPPTGPSPEENIRDMAKSYGDIFMGRDPAYEPTEFHRPGRLGAYLRHAVDSIKGDDDPGQGYFEFLALQVVRCARSLENGMAPEQAGPMLQSIMQDAVNRLLGVTL